MDNLENRCRALAERIYDFDTEVYALSGSTLGRTLISPKETCIEDLSREMMVRPDGDLVTSYLALISKMARTIPDRKQRSRLMSEYNQIFNEVKALVPEVATSDIASSDRVRLNPFVMTTTRSFTTKDRLIICIGRSYGSGGNDIGFRLADRLHMNYYDATVMKDVMERLQAEREADAELSAKNGQAGGTPRRRISKGISSDEAIRQMTAQLLEKNRRLKGIRRWLSNFNRYHGLPEEDALFFNQSDYIAKLAKEEDFIVMGRCADVVLRNARIPHVSIFITAPFKNRVRRVMSMHQIPFREAAKLVKRMDHEHSRVYRRFTGYEWGNATHYDLCVNSASYGIDECVDLIMQMIKARVRLDLNLPPRERKAANAGTGAGSSPAAGSGSSSSEGGGKSSAEEGGSGTAKAAGKTAKELWDQAKT